MMRIATCKNLHGRWLVTGWPWFANGRAMVGQWLADCWPMAGQWLANGLPIVGQRLTNNHANSMSFITFHSSQMATTIADSELCSLKMRQAIQNLASTLAHLAFLLVVLYQCFASLCKTSSQTYQQQRACSLSLSSSI